MVFVTLGTQDKPFTRLLDYVNAALEKEMISDVAVQAGCTKYCNDNMKIFDLVSQSDFEKYIDDCEILVTHGGVGNIFTGLKHNKKIIAVPRLDKYGEHTNNHQTQIVDSFSAKGYILKATTQEEFMKALNEVKKFKPKKYKSNKENFCKHLQDELKKI